MELSRARYLAEQVIVKLKPGLVRAKICGSIRRQKSEVKDIDIVCQPQRTEIKNLFGEVTGYIACKDFRDQVDPWEKIRGEATGKYTQRIFEGAKLELSIADESTFAGLVLIRTGSAEFTHMLMTRINKCGLEHKEGHLYRDGKLIPIKDEKDYFTILDLPFIEPALRDEHAFRRVKV